MNRTQNFLGLALLVVAIVALAFALTEIAPGLIASVGWNAPLVSIGWHELTSVGWVTAPL